MREAITLALTMMGGGMAAILLLMLVAKLTSRVNIEEKQGKRSSLVCQLPFHRVRAIKPLAEAKEELGGRYYTYVASMSGGAYYIVAVDGERGRVGIKIEPSAAFVAATASSTRNFFSSISVSVAPPTLITATLPDNAAALFSNSSFS